MKRIKKLCGARPLGSAAICGYAVARYSLPTRPTKKSRQNKQRANQKLKEPNGRQPESKIVAIYHLLSPPQQSGQAATAKKNSCQNRGPNAFKFAKAVPSEGAQ
jgi:hypothetical protein